MSADIPVWTIVLSIIAFLVNLLVLVVGWIISTKLGDIKETVVDLAKADADQTKAIGAVKDDLAAHKLEVAKTYAKSDDMKAYVSTIFAKLDDLRRDLIAEIDRIMGQNGVERRRGNEQ